MALSVAQRERAALADLFEAVGPDRPTLNEGWDTGDLLSHLLVRERSPLVGLDAVIKPLSTWRASLTRSYDARPWADKVALLRRGPQWFNIIRIPAVDRAINTGEYFIHHEDVRRGQPGWEPRVLDTDTTVAVTQQVTSAFSRLMLKKYGVGFRVHFAGGAERELVKGDPVVTLTGEPGELVLWISGRQRACRVDVSGSPEALAALGEDRPVN